MKIQKTFLEIAKEQFALDYNCGVHDFFKSGNTITKNLWIEGRRLCRNDVSFMKILCYFNKAVITADEQIIPWAEQNLSEEEPSWLFEFSKLNRINKTLNEFGHEIADVHHYYLPQLDAEEINPKQDVKWFEKQDILQFEHDQRFKQAFMFNPYAPDVLAVAAVDGDRIMGMAGASADSETMWQIGIDVVPEFRGKGMAANLTALIKQEIIKRGKVPFYGTVESHNLSKNVAIQAGFLPVWAEAYSQSIHT